MLPLVRRNRGRDIFDRDFMGDFFNNFNQDFANIFEDTRYTSKEGDLVYEIEVPGFNKDNLTVEMIDGILTVKGTRETAEGKREVFKRLRVATSEDVDAKIEDGILYLTLKAPKKDTKKVELK